MKPLRRIIVALVVIAMLILFWAWQIEPRWIEVKYHEIEGTRLAEALSGLRFVVLSDLHVDEFGDFEQKVVDRVKSLSPDYLIWLGDYVKYGGAYDGALEMFTRLQGQKGTYGTLGDAEYFKPRDHCILCHLPGQSTVRSDLPVRFLRDESVMIENNGKKAVLLGLDPATYTPFSINETVLSQTDELPVLIISHYAKAVDHLKQSPVDMMLCGDSHGGQVWLPWPLSRFLYSRHTRRHLAGWYQEGPIAVYLTRGIGTSHAPFRLGSRPEISVIDFKGAAR